MKRYLPYLLTSIMLLSDFSIEQSNAQGKLRINFDDSGNQYVRFFFRTTSWARITELNPGSIINSEQRDYFPDFSMRRLRFGFYSQITPKLSFNMMFGGNNLNHLTGKTFVIRMLDAYAEYEFNKAFAIGGGKTGWQGGSRWEIRSSKSLMGLDAPLYSLTTVERVDDAGRLFGFFVKGQYAKFDYRFVLNQTLTPAKTTPSQYADFAYNAPRPKYSGYVKYQFLDEESNKIAYTTGTYLGKKKVLALGAGFLFQPSAMWTNPGYGNISALQDTLYHDLIHFSADIFFDSPIGESNGFALTAYLGVHKFDFGPNYIRNLGANGMATEVAAGSDNFNGAGNAFPIMGTGKMLFFQTGLLLPKALLNNHGLLQPNFSVQVADWDRLNELMIVYDFDLNWYLKGHDNKFSFGYQLRPVFRKSDLKVDSYKGMWVMQYQIELN